MSEQAIRFSVLSKKGMRSATWKCFVPKGKNDFYLACREIKGAMKASFHESGKCHIGFEIKFLQRYAPKNSPLLKDRNPIKWPEPRELYPGVIRAFRVLIPENVVNVPIKGREPSVFWIASPPTGLTIDVAAYLTPPDVEVSTFQGAILNENALIGTANLLNARKVWLIHRTIKLPPLEFLPGGRPSFFGPYSKEDLKKQGLRMISTGFDSEGSICFLEHIIGYQAII